MKKAAFVFLMFFIFSCKKTDTSTPQLPDCIKKIIANDQGTEKLKTIRVRKMGNELQYWLNTDARFYDGAEYIVNNSCDTVCRIGGFFPVSALCAGDDWEEIWKK
jgi:hypothetical protein